MNPALTVECRSASNPSPPSARTQGQAFQRYASLRCALPALVLRRHDLEGGQLFDADLVNGSVPIDRCPRMSLINHRPRGYHIRRSWLPAQGHEPLQPS